VKSVTLVNGLTMLGLAMFANTGLKSITILVGSFLPGSDVTSILVFIEYS
jgi:hypothetical protein